MNADFSEKSYRRHQEQYDEFARDGSRSEFARSWFREDTVNAWRHARTLRLLNPFIDTYPEAHWLTVGDGRYGREAHYILSRGGQATASDISDTLLKEGAETGFISAYSRQNAENMTFGDKEFDFVLCKESYHHFPRPPVALYEMIRVARVGVILIEPTDQEIGASVRWKIFRRTVDTLRRLKGYEIRRHVFEKSGNYVYGISRRELEKAALGMSMPTIAFRGINDYYLEGVESAEANVNSRLFRRVKRRIALNDLFCGLGLKPHSKTCATLFLEPPSEELRHKLHDTGFEITDLPGG
jgi:ubiquinone/menaquinone biosynthesis C-methylase UbiE